jgi:light-regulated signal transduction histidine kinase (bacteriophytochrome)
VGSHEISYVELFRDAGEAMLLAGPVVLDCNRAALRLFRATRDQIVGRPLHDLYSQQQTDHTGRTAQWACVRPDGTCFTAEVTLSRVGDSGSGYQLALLREQTRQPDTAAAQLEAVTAELDAFSWSVSHDLRAAISGIAACSQIVVNDFGASLSDEARRWLVHIHEDAVQLDKFTEALLELSRVSRRTLDPADLDLTSMAREIAGSLASASSGRAVEFEASEGLEARGDAVLVRTLLQNLLDNAWKFTNKTASGRIEFGVLQSEVFYVRDNGAGFDMAHADRLFVAFQRLHRDPEIPGNGMGLAMVRRIAHRHGGKAWAEGAPGAGSTFYFTLGFSRFGPRLAY